MQLLVSSYPLTFIFLLPAIALATPIPKNRFRPEKLQALRALEAIRERIGANWDLDSIPPEFPWYEYANRVPFPEDFAGLRDPGIWLKDRVDGSGGKKDGKRD